MLPLRPGQKLPQDPVFKRSAAVDPRGRGARCFSRREAKRRAVLRLLDRLPLWPGTDKTALLYAAFRSPGAGSSPIAVLIASSTRSRNTNSSF